MSGVNHVFLNAKGVEKSFEMLWSILKIVSKRELNLLSSLITASSQEVIMDWHIVRKCIPVIVVKYWRNPDRFREKSREFGLQSYEDITRIGSSNH